MAAALEPDVVLSAWLVKSPKPKKHATLKRSWKNYFFLLRKASGTGVARLEYKEQEDSRPKGTFVLSDCVACQKIGALKKYKRGVFELSFKDGVLVTLAAPTDEVMEQWCREISNIVFKTEAQETTRKRLPTSSLPAVPGKTTTAEFVQENLTYHSMDLDEFDVNLSATPDAERLGVVGKHTLRVTSINLTLVNPDSKRTVAVWPIRYLRRYGRDDVAFSFEAGRKCESGPGVFRCKTHQGNDIFVLVDRAAKSLISHDSLHQRGKHQLQSSELSSPPSGPGPALPARVSDTVVANDKKPYNRLLSRPDQGYRELGNSDYMAEGTYGDPDETGFYSTLPAAPNAPTDYDAVPAVIHGAVSGRPDRPQEESELVFYESSEMKSREPTVYDMPSGDFVQPKNPRTPTATSPNDSDHDYEENACEYFVPNVRETSPEEHYAAPVKFDQDTLQRRLSMMHTNQEQ
eukprot:m.53370 g.53370  ORF g.53370 m.53370 type:complete len:461 (+) comp12377_c0_seq1:266-1648(+)